MIRKRQALPLPVVNCVHWTASGLSGTCALGLFNGQPSIGLCKRCTSYSGPTDRVTGEPPPTPPALSLPLLSPERVSQIEEFKSICQDGCDKWLGQFYKIKGTDQDGYTGCVGCRCPAQRVNLLTGYCPEDKWSN